MSRVGLKPIPLPSGVEVRIEPELSSVKGPKGELRQHIPAGIEVKIEDGVLTVHRSSDSPPDRSKHGLVRALIANQVVGVTEGYTKLLDIVGVGYRAEAKGKVLNLQLGHSHPIDYAIPEGIEIKTPDPTHIVVSGIDKQLVGQVAAEIREFRPPEPYKGKGVRYRDEVIRRKAGKAAAKS